MDLAPHTPNTLVDPWALERAFQAARGCDLFLTVGTSAVVQPAASLPGVAAEAGAWTVEVNPEETPLSGSADEYHPGAAATLLPSLLGVGS